MGERIGYFGPGMMGSCIITNLLAKNFPVTIYAHRDGLALEALTKAGATVTRSPAKVAEGSTVFMLTLPSSKEVEATILGSPGLLECLKPGSVVVDLSTSFPTSTKALAARLKEKGIDMLDAPMAGTPVQANAGELNLMVGGEAAVLERCRPIFRAIAKTVIHVGPNSHGNAVKIINNFLGQLSNAGIAEALMLAQKYGLDLKALYDVIKVSGGNSRAFEGAVPTIAKRDFTVRFQLKLAHKDIGYVSALGKEMGVPLPMVNSLLSVLDMAKAFGLGNENTTALIKMWEKFNGVEAKSDKF
jgi:3-hydroxyisobutyrate dehydrogenase-like beta-hydroxyacid dehydrogenase